MERFNFFLPVLAAAAWACAIGLLQEPQILQRYHYILIGMSDAIFIGLGDDWFKGLCCGKLMSYFFAKMYSFQEGFAMI